MWHTYAQIDLSAICENIGAIKRAVGGAVQVMPVIKADAYGHGMVEVAQALAVGDVYAFMVARVEEAVKLREAGIDTPILIQGPTLPQLMDDVIQRDVMQTVSSVESLRMLEEKAKAKKRVAKVLVKLNTGLNRVGIQMDALDSLLNEFKSCSHVAFEGCFTHFATSDAVDKSYANAQLRRFEQGVRKIRAAGFTPLIHAANSGAMHDLRAAWYDVIRPGLSIYGCYPSPHVRRDITLRPALVWKCHVVHVKEIEAGESVSYNRRFTAWRKTKVATICVGYGDGYARIMTEKAQVLISGRRVPVIGTICMDFCMADVTELANVQVGDEVVLLGTQGEETITAEEMAAWQGTINYEVFTGITDRVHRLYAGSAGTDVDAKSCV